MCGKSVLIRPDAQPTLSIFNFFLEFFSYYNYCVRISGTWGETSKRRPVMAEETEEQKKQRRLNKAKRKQVMAQYASTGGRSSQGKPKHQTPDVSTTGPTGPNKAPNLKIRDDNLGSVPKKRPSRLVAKNKRNMPKGSVNVKGVVNVRGPDGKVSQMDEAVWSNNYRRKKGWSKV